MTRELLQQALDAIEAFTDPEDNMPEDTGEFRDLKKAMLAIRAHLAAPQGEPAWHDAPTVPGDWVIVGKGFKSELQTGITQQEIDRVSSWPGQWYGPIPPAPQEPAP